MNKRNKYDYKFRLQCVEAVVKDNCSIRAVAQKKELTSLIYAFGIVSMNDMARMG